PAVLRQSLLVHAGGALVIAVLAFALSPAVAASLDATHLTLSLRVLSVVLLVYGLYAPLVGALNGERRLLQQAGFDIFAATVRTVGLIAGALLWAHGSSTRGAEGACYGFLAGVTLVLVLALAVVGVGRSGTTGTRLRDHVAFVAPLLLGQTLLNLLFQADLTLLRRFAAEAASHAGLPATAADPYVGAYRTTQLFSFLPYQLLMAVTFVLFPMLAGTRRDADRSQAARYVENGLRIALVVTGAMVSVTAGLPAGLLRLGFGAQAAAYGAHALTVLALGFGAFAIFGLLTAVLNGMGRERASLAITFAACLLVVGACFGWVRGGALSETLLVRTACATAAGIALATLLAGILVRRTVGSLVPLRVVARVGFALGAALALARCLPQERPLLVVPEAVLVAGAYLAVLVVTRELGRADLDLVLRVVKRRG
ncbi:MAG TPA: lipopolysaccharide biosynthesis protein, partial [Polyangiaceae bacterium]|nr:lipopolysaccharide biosynthesis protein [Polyangiaceae bacterium]